MTYDEKIEWLFAQFPSYQKVGSRAYKPGTGTMEAFDALLGHPHTQFKTVHIAGTNGKGSVSHMLAAGLSACGMKVGLYTSPHLKDFRERMRIVENSSYRYISQESVYNFLCRWDSFFNECKPSFFEITTAMAFDFFAKEKVDIAVIETGLGGRLDSTNIITPILSVITNIGLEHCEYLGYTLEEIAGEKAGIIKPGVPVVIGEVLPETRPVFEAKASKSQSPIVFAQESAESLGIGPEDLDLKGDYQSRNIKTVAAAAAALQGLLPLDLGALAEGVRRAAAISGLRGRWETLRSGKGSPTVICDTGHNAHGLRWVAQQIDRISCDYRNTFCIFGFAKDKDVDAVASMLPRNVHYIFTQAGSQRSLPAADLANTMHDHGISGKVIVPVSRALEETIAAAGEEDLVFIGGSNFVVAEIL